MTISTLNTQGGLIKSLTTTRTQLFDLQRQLGTGKIAETYSQLDASARTSVLFLREDAAQIEGFQRSILDVSTRAEVAETTVERFSEIARYVKTDVFAVGFDLVDGARSAVQTNAKNSFDEIAALLNTSVGETHIFGGKATKLPPVESADLIFNGDSSRAGVNQLIDERRQADQGADLLGRLVLPAPTINPFVELGTDIGDGSVQVDATDTAATFTASNIGADTQTLDDLGYAEGDTISISDGTTTVTFEIDTANDGEATPGSGNILVGTTGGATYTLANLITDIQANIGGLNATVTDSDATANVALQVDATDTNSTITFSSTGTADLTVLGFTGPTEQAIEPTNVSGLGFVDGESFTVSDGTNFVTFEFDTGNDGVEAGNFSIGSADQTLSSLITAVNNELISAGVNARLTNGGTSTNVQLQLDPVNPDDSITLTATDAAVLTGLGLDQVGDGNETSRSLNGTGDIVLSEDSHGHPFGLKLISAEVTGTGLSVTGPTTGILGAPAEITFTANHTQPAADDTVTVYLQLPDGEETSITLTAVSTNEQVPDDDEFVIGTTPAETANNLQAVLQANIRTIVDTELQAVSGLIAAQSFFDANVDNPPPRIDGPPFDSATEIREGTVDETVIWYTGDISDTPARESAIAKVDERQIVNYGTRADEEAIRNTLASLAVLSQEIFIEGDTNSNERYRQYATRIGQELSFPPGNQSLENIHAELTIARTSLNSANERLTAEAALTEKFIGDRENADTNEVAVQILTLQTRLQASLQTTSSLLQLSIVNFI